MEALNLFLYSIFPGLMERKIVWESCLENHSWGLLEMHILLTEEIVEFDMYFDLDTIRELIESPAMYIQLPYTHHEDLLLSFLMVRCPVSTNDIDNDNE